MNFKKNTEVFKMRKLILLIAFVTLFFACEKGNENTYEVVNLSGVDWYNAQAWFSNHSDPDSEFTGYENIGNIMIGESVQVSTDALYILISAKNSSGGSVMSSRIPLSERVYIRRTDLLSQ